MSLQQVEHSLKNLAISCTQKEHQNVDSFASWIDTVKQIDAKLSPTKTLVLKPSKGTNTNPILVVALASTEFSVGSLAKSLGNKDARVAQDDLVKETFKVDKINITPFALENVEDKSTITVVIDQNMLNDVSLAFRGFSGSNSFIVSSAGLKTFLDTHGGEYKVVDLANLVAASPQPAKKEKPSKQVKEKESDGIFY
jgi:prolyl-tRNA synthetase